MRSFHGCLAMFMFLLAGSSSVLAKDASSGAAAASPKPIDCPICRRANDQQAPYGQKATATLARGLTNTTFGWTELLVQPASAVNAKENLLNGIGKGITNAVTRTALGFGELFTFWSPKGTQGYSILAEDCPICLQAARRQLTTVDAPTPPPNPMPTKNSSE